MCIEKLNTAHLIITNDISSDNKNKKSNNHNKKNVITD